MAKLEIKRFKLKENADVSSVPLREHMTYVHKDGKQDEDEVIEQPYKKGEKVDITTEIVLTISKGNGKETPKTTEKPKPQNANKASVEDDDEDFGERRGRRRRDSMGRYR